MENLRPQVDRIELNGRSFVFKCYLKMKAFSYRCVNHYTHSCKFLLTIPLTAGNYDPETWKFISANGAFQASKEGHSIACSNYYKENKSTLSSSQPNTLEIQQGCEWGSDVAVLKDYIRKNLTLIPSTIQIEMKKIKQNFNISQIKNAKREIWDEIFPKDALIAFNPSNCKILEAQDSYEDNLYRFYGRFLPEKRKDKHSELFEQQEYYIFATRLMLFHLSQAHQWFIDGTFDVAPSGFKQLLIIMVYLQKFHVFYPAAYITLTGKSESLYFHAFSDLKAVAIQHEFSLKPTLVMSDFESGLRNAIIKVWELKEENMVGCYFHFVKACVIRCKTLGLLPRKNENKETKLMLGLIKILVHCKEEIRNRFFQDIKSLFKNKANFKKFFEYFEGTWLKRHKNFLDGLIKAYTNNSEDIHFIRTNNPCELYNKYLGILAYFVSFI